MEPLCRGTAKTEGRDQLKESTGLRYRQEEYFRLVRLGRAGRPCNLHWCKLFPFSGRAFPTGDGLKHVKLSQLDKALLRPDLGHFELATCVASWGEKWGNILSRLMWLDSRYELLFFHLRSDFSDELTFIQYLKSLSQAAISLATLKGEPQYLLLADLHIVGGYDTILNRGKLSELISGVFAEPTLPEGYDENLFYSCIDEVLSAISLKLPAGDYKHFVQFRDAWASPGASTLENKVVLSTPEGRRIKVRGKLASTLNQGDSELVANSLRRQNAVVKPFLKMDEPVKSRVVYGYDFYSYLRCSYLESFVKDLNGPGFWTTVGLRSADKLMFRESILARLNSRWFYSIDQDKFDLHQRLAWVERVIEKFGERIVKFAQDMGLYVDDVEEILAAELHGIRNSFIDGKQWKHGLPSGHKLTSLIGTVLNAASTKYCLKRAGVRDSSSYFQGDDALVILPQKVDFLKYYGELGLEVNPSKTWISQRSCEFLHELYTPSNVSAFPARVAKSLIFAKPGLSNTIGSSEDRLRERISDCLKGYRRGLPNCYLLALRILLRVTKLSRKAVVEMANTPTFLGGFGFGEKGRRVLVISGGEVQLSRYKIISGVSKRIRVSRALLIERFAETTLLRTDKVVYSSKRLRLPKTVPSFRLRSAPIARTAFDLTDQVPWATSVNWDACLRSGRLPKQKVLPSLYLRTLQRGMGFTKLFHYCRKFVQYSKLLKIHYETTTTVSESFCVSSDVANRIYRGFASHLALFGGKNVNASLLYAERYVLALFKGLVVPPLFSIKV